MISGSHAAVPTAEELGLTRKVSVLLVDDRPNALITLSRLLDDLDLHIVTATSGEEALDRVRETEFAVVLLDVRMPGMDGFQTARVMRKNEKTAGTPIIFLTGGLKNEEEASEGYRLGAVDYLLKPFNREVLCSKVAVFVDLARKNNQLRQLNKVLEARTAELVVANRELESFSSSVSHDLRAPLRAISGFSQLLVEHHSQALDDVSRSYLMRINRASQRMGELIDSLLSLSRVSRAELRSQQVDLGRLAFEIVNDLANADPVREVDCRIATQLLVDGDPELLRSALGNLLGNAWKFTRGVPKPRVEFGVLESDERVFFVRDNGAGFDMAHADRLFNPFQRLHTSDEFPGSGIGLATVQRIITRHRGRVWAESKVNEGATFYFTLGD